MEQYHAFKKHGEGEYMKNTPRNSRFASSLQQVIGTILGKALWYDSK